MQITEPLLTARDARALATTRERAGTLFFDGYTAEPTTLPGVYRVFQPAGRKIGKGQKPFYTVNAIAQTCDCAAFARLRTCKHAAALTARVAEAVAFLGPLLPAAQPAPAAPTALAAPARGFTSRAAYEKARAADFD